MNFLHPNLALAGAIGIAVPIIIHLLMRRRRTPVPWAAMRFLLEAYKKQRRRMQVEQLLLLASRCLLVALIGGALAGPLIGAIAAATRGPRSVVIVLDNSLASSATDSSGKSALDRAKASAATVLSQLTSERGDTAGLVTLGAPADAAVLPPTTDLAGVRSLIEQTQPTQARADLPGALERIASGFSAAPPAPGVTRQIVLLSDLRAGSADVREPLPPLGNSTAALLALPPAQDPLDNISVASVTPLRSVLIGAGEGAAGSDPVTVELQRSGPGVNSAASSLVSVRVLDANGQGPTEPAGTAVVRWSAGQETARVSVPTTLPARVNGSRLILRASVDRDAIEADNQRSGVVQSRDRVQVGLLDARPLSVRASIDTLRPSDWFSLALDPAGGPAGISGAAGVRIGYEPPRALVSGGASLSGYDALFIPDPRELGEPEWARVRAFTDAGGLVLIAPPPDTGPQTWTEAFSRAMGLNWSFEREPRELATPARIAPGTIAQAGSMSNALLGLIAAELPELSKAVGVRRVLGVSAPPEDVVLALDDHTPLILAAQPGGESSLSRGMVIAFTSALDLGWTDLPAKPLAVPLVQELVRQGVGRNLANAEAIAGTTIRVMAGATELRSISPRPISVPVDATGKAAAPIRIADLLAALDARGRELGTIAVNPDVRGGQTRVLAKEAAESWLSKAAGNTAQGAPAFAWLDDKLTLPQAAPGGNGKGPRDSSLSFWLLLAGACVAVFETILARLVSHAGQSRRASALSATPDTILQEAA